MRQPTRVVAVGFILLAATSASAQVPQLIRYQGTLVDANNVPLEGSYTLTFRLYDAATAGNILWTETQTAIAISRGVFNVLLGQGAPLTLSFDKDYWLSTQVGTDVEMAPRQRLTSVPYAYRAQVAEQLAEQPPRFEMDTAGTLPNGLVAYWKTDESSGFRADSKGTNALTDNNTVTQTVGKKGNAAQFTAVSSKYLSIADNADLSMGDIDFTIALWVYMDTVDAVRVFIDKGTDGSTINCEYRIWQANAGDIFRFSVGNGTDGTILDTNFVPVANTWYFIVAWHDATADTINAQINNGSVQSAARTGGSYDSAGAFNLGRRNDGVQYWNGRIDEVGIWKRVLTAQERADMYNAGAGNTYIPGGFYVDSPVTGKRYRLLMEEVL